MTTTQERIDFIKKIHLFADLSDDDLEDVARALTDEERKAKEHIIEQGSRGDSFYIIYNGTVEVSRRRARRERIVLAQLGPRDYFGEEELFHQRARSATITAISDCSFLVLNAGKIAALMKQVPSFKPTFATMIATHRLWRQLRFKWVRSEEAVYFLARKHPIVLWRSLFWPILALTLPLAGFLWGLATGSMLAMALALGAAVFNLLWILWRYVDWTNDYYLVTSQRVAWVEKVIGLFDSRTEAPLSTILSVGVETDTLGRMLDYGNVIVRTYVGKIAFQYVKHPRYAASMIEEYWNRTKEATLKAEKEAIKNAIRKRLDLSVPPPPETPAAEPKPSAMRPGLFRLAGSNIFKLKVEDGETVTYRKHGFVLWRQIWQPTFILLLLTAAFLWRSYLLWIGAVTWPDSIFYLLPLLGLPFLGWWLYQYVDWSNDIFQVTPDQVIDIDKTPFGTQERRAAALESILSIESKRVGLLGNLFNFGTVYIVVGGNKLEFQDVFDPATVQSDIDRRRVARIAAKSAAQAALDRERMADWIATYHRGSEEFREEENRRLEETRRQQAAQGGSDEPG
ncbi:MAG: hypothetical protein HFACDABA_00885 [Anaerolineales bacterium]|nr:hypothetical protein [Anaerolineales bacterium]